MVDFEYHITNIGHVEEVKIKIIAFQIIKAIQLLAEVGKNHG